MRIAAVLGTRPEIIKFSPLIPLLDERFDHILIHTGQHYSYRMDRIFFRDLKLRNPDFTLEVGSGSQAVQTAKIMIRLENTLQKVEPDLVMVLGDTNSTLSGAITASKMGIKLAHIEAGCRSKNKKMPEETNRIVADHLSDILFAPDNIAYHNLIEEGINKEKIKLVGSTVFDAIKRNIHLTKKTNFLRKLKIEKDYAILTLHRAETTDDINRLQSIAKGINFISNSIKIIFPIHPRTRIAFQENEIELNSEVMTTPPLGYLDFLSLLSQANLVLTDSGGIQEEAAYLNIPCLILRDETEWQRLVDLGKNLLLSSNSRQIISRFNKLWKNPSQIDKMKKIELPKTPSASRKIINILKSGLL